MPEQLRSTPEPVDLLGVSSPKVLAIDDETVSRLVLCRMLRGLGLEVSEASDVPEALGMLQTAPFDLVVSDYLMPSGTGLRVAELAAAKSIPFILVTGFGHEMDLGDSLDRLVGAHLTKPVSSDDLRQAVAASGVDVGAGAGADADADRHDQEPHDSEPGSMAVPGAESDPEVSSSRVDTLNFALLDGLGVEVTLVDSAAQIIVSTAGSRDTLGYDEEFWQRANLFDVIHPGDLSMAQKGLAALLASPGDSLEAIFRVSHADGHWEPVEVHGANLLDKPGIEAVVLTTRSVGVDEALRNASTQSQFVASVSHELRSPLHGILGVAQLLEDQVVGESAEFVRLIRTEAERLSRVIDDILNYSKADNGALVVAPAPTSIRQIISDVSKICQTQAKPNVHLWINIDPDVPAWVLVDGPRLHQVLLNLTANATRFTSSGSIELSCRPISGDRLFFAVSDTGIGIPPDEITTLFEPFRQGQGGQAAGGTGLGLAISNNLIRLMDGRLDVESVVGQGSTFSFGITAPRTSNQSHPTAVGIPESNALTSVSRALVIDDAKVNQLVIGRQLESMGFAVETAECGIEGLEISRYDGPFDLLITDWHMPKMDGLEVIRRLREFEATNGRHTPIVMMTASALDADRATCLAAGADHFLAKPSTRAELCQLVSQYLPNEPAEPTTPAQPTQPTQSARSAQLTQSAPPSSQELSHRSTETVMAGSSVEVAAVFDSSILDELAAELDNTAAVVSVVDTFLLDLPKLTGAISVAVASGDIANAARSAHTLRSPSLMLGAVGLGSYCRQIEESSSSSDLDTHNIEQFSRLTEQTRTGLIRWTDGKRD